MWRRRCLCCGASKPQQTLIDHVDEISTGYRLGYVTDVEGNIDYFRAFVRRSNVLDFLEDDVRSLRLSLRDGCFFVFGGDSVDKGPGDIRLTRALVDLKIRYPTRVFLLVGNRDINKIRFVSELSQADMARDVDNIMPPFWNPKATTLKQFLNQILKEEQTKNKEDGVERTFDDVNTRVNRLKYMLEHTLGCTETFEFRREELSILSQCSLVDVSDETVLKSFLDEVILPEGTMRLYLELADVVVVIGNTIFVHGAVDEHTMRFVPRDDSKFELPTRRPKPAKMCNDARQWAESLNSFFKRGLEDFRQRPDWNADRTSRGGEAVLALHLSSCMWGRSVIGNFYGDGGVITHKNARKKHRKVWKECWKHPLRFEALSSDPTNYRLAAWLKKNGIRRVMVGHRPTGDCPAILSAFINNGVEIASADTSYSDIKSKDNRGAAVSVLELEGKNDCDNRLVSFGTTNDGVEYHSNFPRLYGEKGIDAENRLLGTLLQDGWWVKAVAVDGMQYRLCRGEGFKVEQKWLRKGLFRGVSVRSSLMFRLSSVESIESDDV